MTTTDNESNTRPPFKKCPRCGYALRGLPASHACPECGLRYDPNCGVHTVINARQMLFVWMIIFTSGWVVLRNLSYVPTFAKATLWQKIGVMAALLWLGMVVFGVWFVVKRYREGFKVVVTGDGLLIRLPDNHKDVIPWTDIADATINDKKDTAPQVATIVFTDQRKPLSLGGTYNLFPKREDVERFVRQVRAHLGEDEG